MGLRPKAWGGFAVRMLTPRWGSTFLLTPHPRPPLGLRPKPRWWLPLPDSLLNGVWGGAPAGVWRRSPQLHSCGKAAPGFGAPTPCVHDSFKPAGLVRRQICLNPVLRVGCKGSRSEPEQSEGERSEGAEDQSPPSQAAVSEVLLKAKA